MFARIIVAASLLLALPAAAQDAAPLPVVASPQPVDTAPHPAYDRDTPIEKLAADPAAAAILNKRLPGLLTDAQYPLFKRMSLHAIQQASGGDLSSEDVDKTVADLQALFPQ
jgi:hypothetical protein